MKRVLLLGFLLAVGTFSFAKRPRHAKAQHPLQAPLAEFVASYQLSVPSRDAGRIESLKIDDANKRIVLELSEKFTFQPWDRQRVSDFHDSLRVHMPKEYRHYRLEVSTKGVRIEDLVHQGEGSETPQQRTWKHIRHHDAPWVLPLDRAYNVHQGLENRHISLWASHGRYYSAKEGWRWQRPQLFCTTEDLLSQTIVVPYLMPMLENAGAILYSPRERDWQVNEVIVDNDTPQQDGIYQEASTQHHWEHGGPGFAHYRSVYHDHETPFTEGTTRVIPSQSRRSQAATATWMPNIPADGRYAVYVAYTTLPTSVSDATYTIYHRGRKSQVRVNQQMGGGTWVYLGTFEFASGCTPQNAVVLSNVSEQRGHITADAVRFGGGMGNIARGPVGGETVSGLPRFLEGARYGTQWQGAPYWVYGNKNSENDYAEDINARSLMTNHLAGGSAYVPSDSGLHVPIELSLALHTDAGASREGGHIGSLSIYTSDFNDRLLPTGLSRLTSRDFADLLLTQLNSDLCQSYGAWNRRSLYDRNYSETRLPEMPSAILEMLSHQNFPDLRLAHDPAFKFTVARAVYKGVLRFLHEVHNERPPVVQPLPVAAPSAIADPQHQRILVTWQAVNDPLEPTARPERFVVYHAEGDLDFDNGTSVRGDDYTLDNAAPGVLHRFRIAAANDGGQSLLSTEVCAYIPATTMPTTRAVLVLDAFSRMAGPRPIDNDSVQGFDFDGDPGVPMAVMPGYCGRQVNFDREQIGREGPSGLGYSTTELQGILLSGNTHDWSTRHARDLITASGGAIIISSGTAETMSAVPYNTMMSRLPVPSSYRMIDLVLGMQKNDGYSLRRAAAFTPQVMQLLNQHTGRGGSLLVSGAYIGSDMSDDEGRSFTRSVLKYDFAGSLPPSITTGVSGMGLFFDYFRYPGQAYPLIPSLDCLAPTSEAFCPLVYAPDNHAAAVAYQGRDYSSLALGFPMEAITDATIRAQLWQGFLDFLLPR